MIRLLETVLGDFSTSTVLSDFNTGGNSNRMFCSPSVRNASWLTRHRVLFIRMALRFQSTSCQVSANISPLRRDPENAKWIARANRGLSHCSNNTDIWSGRRNWRGLVSMRGRTARWKGLREMYSHKTACSNALYNSLWISRSTDKLTVLPQLLW